MKDVYEVLRQKELDLRRVQTEVESLHVVIPLLTDDVDRLEHGIVIKSIPGQNVSIFNQLQAL